MNSWQPIETAPKDVSQIIVAWPVEQWKKKPSDPTIIHWYMTVVKWEQISKKRGEWSLTETGSYAQDSFTWENFTHWMPRPEPPNNPTSASSPCDLAGEA